MGILLVILFIFGSVALIICRLLSFSENRYGPNSPLKVTRTYRITFWGYFTSYEQLIAYPFLLVAVVCFISPFTEKFSFWQDSTSLKYLLVISIFLVSLYIFAYHISLQLNYWKFTKNVVINSVPSDQSLRIFVDNEEILLRSGDLEKILVVSNKGRIAFSYFTYYLKNGGYFILTDRTPGRWIIEEYFGKIHTEHFQEHFPFIK